MRGPDPKSEVVLRPLDVTIPADFPSAAFFLVAGLLHPRSRLEFPAVGLNPTRTGLLQALRAMGANIHVHNSAIQGGEPVGDVLPVTSELRGIEVSGGLTPLMIDEFPIFAVAATQAKGVTVVRDARRVEGKGVEPHRRAGGGTAQDGRSTSTPHPMGSWSKAPRHCTGQRWKRATTIAWQCRWPLRG